MRHFVQPHKAPTRRGNGRAPKIRQTIPCFLGIFNRAHVNGHFHFLGRQERRRGLKSIGTGIVDGRQNGLYGQPPVKQRHFIWNHLYFRGAALRIGLYAVGGHEVFEGFQPKDQVIGKHLQHRKIVSPNRDFFCRLSPGQIESPGRRPAYG